MKHLHPAFSAIVCLFLLVSFNGHAASGWALTNDQSSLTFVSTKNQNFSETHTFSQLSGTLSEQGLLKIEIALASIQSGIGIRDTRMQEELFMVEQFPKATITAALPAKLMQMQAGESVQFELPARLKILNFENEIKANVQITKTSSGELIATSTRAILISANDYGLTEGVGILQKLAGLSSIGLTVPVSFNVVFAEQGQ